MMEYQNKSAVGMGCNSSLRPACSRCYGGLGKLTVDGGKDNSADAVTYAEAEVGAGLQSAQLLLLPRRKRSFSLLWLRQLVVGRSTSRLEY